MNEYQKNMNRLEILNKLQNGLVLSNEEMEYLYEDGYGKTPSSILTWLSKYSMNQICTTRYTTEGKLLVWILRNNNASAEIIQEIFNRLTRNLYTSNLLPESGKKQLYKKALMAIVKNKNSSEDLKQMAQNQL